MIWAFDDGVAQNISLSKRGHVMGAKVINSKELVADLKKRYRRLHWNSKPFVFEQFVHSTPGDPALTHRYSRCTSVQCTPHNIDE
jgi:hypothetical protein